MEEFHPESIANSPNSVFDEWLTQERYQSIVFKQKEMHNLRWAYSNVSERQEELQESLVAAGHGTVSEDSEEDGVDEDKKNDEDMEDEEYEEEEGEDEEEEKEGEK